MRTRHWRLPSGSHSFPTSAMASARASASRKAGKCWQVTHGPSDAAFYHHSCGVS